MAPQQACRYFAMGSCTNGSKCTFSHDVQAKLVCEYYLKGNCQMGKYCKLSHQKPKPLAITPATKVLSTALKISNPPTAWTESKIINKFQKTNFLGKINPAKPDTEVVENTNECVVCLEIVSKKKDPRFGIMDCHHCVCLSCARQWRETESVDTCKTCPICRNITRFVTPSLVWPENDQMKKDILEGYRNSLGNIHCKHYARGKGICPFGTSCLYKHTDMDGRNHNETIRLISNGDETLAELKNVSLLDFMDK